MLCKFEMARHYNATATLTEMSLHISSAKGDKENVCWRTIGSLIYAA